MYWPTQTQIRGWSPSMNTMVWGCEKKGRNKGIADHYKIEKVCGCGRIRDYNRLLTQVHNVEVGRFKKSLMSG
jgi:hypothetical protein